MRLLLTLIATVALVACGGEESKKPMRTGLLQVQARSLQSGTGPAQSEVASIVVTATDTADTDHTFELHFDETLNVWEGTSPRLYTGDYIVTAEALGEDGETVLFASEPMTATVQHNQTATIILVLNQQTTGADYTPPIIRSVFLDRQQVEQDDPIQIRVNVTDGVGPYTLSGRHALSEPFPGTFSGGGAMEDGMGQMTWTAPFRAGPAWFVLVVTDAEGNVAELGVSVIVGNDYGFLEASVTFNLAPSLWVNTRTLNDGDAATFYFWVDVEDTDSTGDIAYEWTSLCGATWHTEGYSAPSGTLADGTVDAVFKADLVGSARDAGNCTFVLVGTDAEGASSSLLLHVPTLEAPVESLSESVYLESFAPGGSFMASATPMGNGIFKWRRTDAQGAMNITAPIAYFLHRAGHTTTAALGFEDMHLRTSADPMNPANFNSMDLGVLLYAYEVTGLTRYLDTATAMFPAWMAKYEFGTPNNPRDAWFGYDLHNLMLGAHKAAAHNLPGSHGYLADFMNWYAANVGDTLAMAPVHTIWTNLVADELGVGSRDDSYSLDVNGDDASLQNVAFAVFSDSVDPSAASTYIFDNLASADTSEEIAEALAATVMLGW